MPKNWKWITPPTQSFSGLPISTQLDGLEADIAIIGLHYESPYPPKSPADSGLISGETSPDAIRRQSAVFTGHLYHHDFDFNEPLLTDPEIRIVDCGDVDKPIGDRIQKPEYITSAIGTLLDQGTVPIAIGTDEGNIIPVMRAYNHYHNLCVIHIDAHIDWRDERDGVKEGYSSGMRRTAEMPWVSHIAHVGLRGIGSARQKEIDDALSFGSVFIRAREVHQEGIGVCIGKIPAAHSYVITIDADALDTAIAPGVLFPSPGGLTFSEITDLLHGIATQGKIVGINLFEVRPERDINGITASTAAQLIIHFIGILSRNRQPGR